jgi:hypothetical protein
MANSTKDNEWYDASCSTEMKSIKIKNNTKKACKYMSNPIYDWKKVVRTCS